MSIQPSKQGCYALVLILKGMAGVQRFSASCGLTLGIGHRQQVGTGGLFLAMTLMKLHSEVVLADPVHPLRAFWITRGVAQGLQL